jgi:hypothetical protein
MKRRHLPSGQALIHTCASPVLISKQPRSTTVEAISPCIANPISFTPVLQPGGNKPPGNQTNRFNGFVDLMQRETVETVE